MSRDSLSAPPAQILAGPAMKTALLFGAGILLAARSSPPLLPLAAMLAVFATLLILLRKRQPAGDMLAAAVIITAGMFAYAAETKTSAPLVLPASLKYGEITLAGEVAGDARFRNGNTSFTLRCHTISAGGTTAAARGSIACTAPNRTIPLIAGMRLSVTGKITKSLFSRGNPLFPDTPGGRERFAVSTAPGGLTVLDGGGTFFGNIRESIAALASRYEFGGERDIVLAMTVGDTRALPPETRETFTRSGIAHLLAVSGLNVAIIGVAAAFLFGMFPIPRKTVLAATGAAIFCYAGVCGFSPPVTRALVMSLLVAGAFFLERRNDIENTLFAALLVVLAFDPFSLGGASLQLSFASVWILTVFFSPVMNCIPRAWKRRKLVRYLLGIAVATVLASSVTAPIAAIHFGLFPLLSLPLNIPAVPIAEAVTVLGLSTLGTAALGPAFESVAPVLSHVTGLLVRTLSFLAANAANIPFASLETGGIPAIVLPCFAFWLYLLSRAAGRPVFRKGLVYIPLVLIAIWTWEPVAASSRNGESGSVTFFDVGQGDAALVECGGRHFLIDTGPGFRDYTAAEAVLIPAFRDRGIRRLDGVFISHFDRDHAGGLDVIMQRMTVTRLFCRESAGDSLRNRYGGQVCALGTGDSLAIPGGGLLVLLAPDGEIPENAGENALSLVFRFDVEKTRVLFTGDIDPHGQRKLLRWGDRLTSDVLKIPHHGGAGLVPEFLAAVHPRVAVISCGLNNRHGHPAPSTIQTIRNDGCVLWRTDRDGTAAIADTAKQTP